MSTPTLAKQHGSPLLHQLIKDTKQTKCGRDASLMARFAPIDMKASGLVGRPCEKCRVVVSVPAGRCAKHPAFEADYCPSCGTSRVI